jgi:hypothetical protein
MSPFTKEELLAILDAARDAMCEQFVGLSSDEDREAAARLLMAWNEIRGLVDAHQS